MARKNKTEHWPLDQLQDHPKQAEFFGDLSDADQDTLAADMKARGQRTPVEVLPDGTIVTGHQRVRAAKKLGWKAIEVVVRHDLEKAGAAAVEELFIADNLVRRHLSPLAKARCIKRLLEVKTGDKPWGLNRAQTEKLKEEIGARLGLTLRSVNRYLLLLKAPVAVQAAFDQGAVTLTDAGKVALLDPKAQARIARRIEAGEKATHALAEALRPASGGHDDNTHRAFVRLVSALKRELPRLEGQAGAIKPRRLQNSVPVLTQARAVLAALAKQTKVKAG